MDIEYYKGALSAAMADHAELTRIRGEIDVRLARLTETINSLTRLVGIPDLEDELVKHNIIQPRDVGLSVMCQKVLKDNREWMTAVEIRDKLIELGLDVKGTYTNPLAVLHTTLRRLGKQGLVDVDQDISGGRIYRWGGANPVKNRTPPVTNDVTEVDDEIPF